MRGAYLAAQGVSPNEICDRLNITKKVYNKISRTAEFIQIYNELLQDFKLNSCADLATMFVKDGMKSFKRLQELRDQGNDLRVSLGATKEILDRALPKIEQKEVREVKLHFTSEDMGQLRDTMAGIREHLSGPIPVMESSREAEAKALGGRAIIPPLLPVDPQAPPVPSLSIDEAMEICRADRLADEEAA